MAEPAPGDLFAVLWEAQRPGEVDSYRVIEIVSIDEDHAHVWFYRDLFDAPPAEIDVGRLERILLHEAMGSGPIPFPLAELSVAETVPVRRAGTV